jgi:tripartite-type tricarboxylate transporter receptor subunit TctC
MVMNFFKRLSVLLALGWSAATWAQGTYPQKTVTLTVPFPAGGIADLSARALKPSLDKALGQPEMTVHRRGASGAMGAAAAANATADGYTLMYTLSSVASVPAQAVLFAAALKAIPKGMTNSSSGNYGINHFPAEMLLAATQTESRHIPDAGGAPMLTALMGGQVDFNIPVRTLALPHVQSGRLRYLAMYGARRWAQAPDVPTLSELGVPIDFVPWTGLFAPAGTPADVLATLRKALRAASQDNQFVETVGKSSAGEIAYLDGSELETFWKADLARTSVTIQRIGRIQ